MRGRGSLEIGCSGFSYRDWMGTFYPAGTRKSELLSFYERYFSVVEVNYTFYSMPHPYTMEGFLERTKRLRFAVKVNRLFTHERRFTRSDAERFLEGCAPLTESGRFIAFLFQFPQSFHYSPESVDFIGRLSETFGDYRKAVEVRSRSFGRAEFYREMEEMGLSLVNVDAPKVRGILVGPWRSVGEFNYVRLHGRNRERWFEAEESYERYDYLYPEKELRELKDRIERIREGKETYVFFNNHYRGKAALNALKLKELFGEKVRIPAGLIASFSERLWE